jgi:hypothetical protein
MSVPMGLLQIEIFLAILTTANCWYNYDENNYTDVICGIIGTIFWFSSAMTLSIGVHGDGIDYVGGWLTWIFIGIAIVCALIAIVRLIDTLRLRRSERNVDMEFDMKL